MEYGLSSSVGLRWFASGHIHWQCWGSFAIQSLECWLSWSRVFERGWEHLNLQHGVWTSQLHPCCCFPGALASELGHGE